MNETKEKAALKASVGADAGQSIQSTTTEIITAESPEINDLEDISQEKFFLQMQRMADPAYLHTVSMNELYETVYQSKQPVIEGLLYSGTYLFAGAPKMGKSFFMAQLAYHVSTGQKLWEYEVHQGTVLYLALEDDYQRLQELKAEIASLREDLAYYRSPRFQMKLYKVEKENNDLRDKLRVYNAIIDRYDLGRFFGKNRDMGRTRDEAR